MDIEELEALWTVQGAGPGIASMVTVLPVVIYIVARWRSYREGTPHDPQLGLKVALSFFRILAYQVVLLGLAMFAYGMLLTEMGGDAKEAIMRTAIGLLVPGLLIFGAHWKALSMTNQTTHPSVTRTFSGLSLAQTGIVGFVALVMAFVIALQKGSMGEIGRLAWATAIVYVVAWGLQGMMFMRHMDEPGLPPGSVPLS